MPLPQFTQKAIDAINWLVGALPALKALVGNGAPPRTDRKMAPLITRGVNTPELTSLTCGLVVIDNDADHTVFGGGVYWADVILPRNASIESAVSPGGSGFGIEVVRRRCLFFNHAEAEQTTHDLVEDGFDIVPALVGVYYGTAPDDEGVLLPAFHGYHIRIAVCEE